MWSIEVQLDGSPMPLELCRCVTVESVAAIVTALCRSTETRPFTVRRISPPVGMVVDEHAWIEKPS